MSGRFLQELQARLPRLIALIVTLTGTPSLASEDANSTCRFS